MRGLIITNAQYFYKDNITSTHLDKLKAFIDKQYKPENVYVIININKDNQEGDYIPSVLMNYKIVFTTNDNFYLKDTLKQRKVIKSNFIKQDDNTGHVFSKSGHNYYIDKQFLNFINEIHYLNRIDIVGYDKSDFNLQIIEMIEPFESLNVLENLSFKYNEVSLYEPINWSYVPNQNKELKNFLYYKESLEI